MPAVSVMLALMAGLWLPAACGPPRPAHPLPPTVSTAPTPTPTPTERETETVAPAPSFEADGRPFLEGHCTECHAADEPEAGLALARYCDAADAPAAILRDFRTFDVVAEYVRDGTMPPESEPRPGEDETRAFLAWLDAALAQADRDAPPDPGRVTLRRLNRIEYRNTVRDLLGVDGSDRVRDFPTDDVGYGFDNIGDVLTMPPLLFERYLAAAEEIAARALSLEDSEHPPVYRFAAGELPTTTRGGVTPDGGRYFSTNGDVTATVRVPREGDYVLRAVAWGMQAGPDVCRLALRVNDHSVAERDVAESRAAPGEFEARVHLAAGAQRIGAAFVNDYYAPRDPDPAQRDRNLAVESVTLIGPVDAADGPPSESRTRLLAPGAGSDDEDARRVAILRVLCDRAFRRPATDGEVGRLAMLWKSAQEGNDGAAFERGLQVALTAVLVSPNFLYRVERHPHPGDPAWVRDLDDFALASRLSYFMWSTMPDERLLRIAREGRLHRELGTEAARMLDDQRADELIRNFGSQWLETRRLATASPDPARFPSFDDDLRASMQHETEAFLIAILRENRSAREILSANWTIVDERLARHYGIDASDVAAAPSGWGRVTWPDGRRAGVLGHASVLTVTSYPTRTSPVRRAKWLLQEIAGNPTPPPPPGAGDLPESSAGDAPTTLRERLEQHRARVECAVCHDRLDPLGFALENFDAVGRWRTAEDGAPIDASGTLPDGTVLGGPAALRNALLRGDAFVTNLTSKLLTYAIGRGPLPSDIDVVQGIVRETRADGHRLRDLILGVVSSAPFRRHRGERIASPAAADDTAAHETTADPAAAEEGAE